LVARNFAAGLSMQAEDSLRKVVEPLACLGEQHSTALPFEQGSTERTFEDLHTLADGRLRQAKRLGRPGEAAQFSRFREGLQIRQLQIFWVWGTHGS
jgi:hypothetical protein